MRRAKIEQTSTYPLTAAEGGRLMMKLDRGTLRVLPGAVEEARLEFALEAVSTTREEAQALIDGFSPEISVDGDRITIVVSCGPSEEGRTWWRRIERRLDLAATLVVPRRQSLDLELQMGEIRVEDAEGAVSAAVQVGDIHIGTAAGDLSAETQSGSIAVRQVEGRLVARTRIGRVRVDEAGSGFEIATGSGDIVTRMLHPLGEDSRITAEVGRIDLALAPAVGAEVDARAQVGQIVSDFPLGVESSPGRLRGSIHGGGPRLTVACVTGGIRLSAA